MDTITNKRLIVYYSGWMECNPEKAKFQYIFQDWTIIFYFEKIFASSELGWRKPAPQFFQAVESRLQKEPESLLLIGDDPRLDIAAAKAAGWKSMRIG